ncbi:hypothetical protein [Mesorhizobium caraganae]|uniref:hypothetical protein n=1 Tax=Mesorhizobium caraganae TaxID=483206 RepID=UPI003ECCF71D
MEGDPEAQIFGHGLNFFHLENWYSIHAMIRNGLRVTGLFGRGLPQRRKRSSASTRSRRQPCLAALKDSESCISAICIWT